MPKVFPEYFDVAQFLLPNMENHFSMKRPDISFGKSVGFKWQEYNANLKIQCHLWESIMHSCINIYGYFEYLKHIKCVVFLFLIPF